MIVKDTKKKEMTMIWCCRNKNGSNMDFHPLLPVFISFSICQEELMASCWLFGLLEHKKCSRVNLFLKMILVGVVGSSSGEDTRDALEYIGGTDISFLKEDPSTACAAVVVLDADTLEVVHEEFDVVRLQVPYIPGFLAFREAPILLGLLEKVKNIASHFYPQLLMVDGNGLLHPRGFGLASHLGVLADLPTIGVGKNLHHVDGLNQSEVRRQLEGKENCNKEFISLTGLSGTTWGVAMRSSPGSSKPVYISIGHRISLDSATAVVKLCCKYRVPEPTRQADIRSKVFLQKIQRSEQ